MRKIVISKQINRPTNTENQSNQYGLSKSILYVPKGKFRDRAVGTEGVHSGGARALVPDLIPIVVMQRGGGHGVRAETKQGRGEEKTRARAVVDGSQKEADEDPSEGGGSPDRSRRRRREAWSLKEDSGRLAG